MFLQNCFFNFFAPFDMIENVKDLIQEKENTPSDQHCLPFDGILQEGGLTVSDQSIQESSLHQDLRLKETIQAFFKIFTGQTITLQVEPSDTIVKFQDIKGDLCKHKFQIFN